MAKSKTLLILANSIKHWPGVCIAGREIQEHDEHYTIGPWIRPVSTHGEGELSPSECRLSNGVPPKVMGFVEVGLEQKQHDRLQPENWLVDATTKWKSATQFRKPSMDLLVETPPNLWVQPGERLDRISSAHLQQNLPAQSLYLIQVQNLRARFEWNEWDGRYKQRRRAIFYYNGIEYEFNITDPIFCDMFKHNFPAKGQPPTTFIVSPVRDSYLCVSLAPEFNGYHYKVAATIFLD